MLVKLANGPYALALALALALAVAVALAITLTRSTRASSRAAGQRRGSSTRELADVWGTFLSSYVQHGRLHGGREAARALRWRRRGYGPGLGTETGQ